MGTTQLDVTLYIFTLLLLTLCVKGQVSPQFSEDTYTINCTENTVKDSVLLILTATDTDSGPAGQIDYSMEENEWFRINQTGAIKVKAAIDAEDKRVSKVMNYIVTATDRGTPSRSSTATVRITIVDVNEHRPSFKSSLYLGTLFDKDPVGTPVVQVEATDLDRDAVLTYDLSIPFPYLHIDNHTGNITVSQTVDYDAILAGQGRGTFPVKVRVNDTGRFLVIGTLLISIKRKNHIPPKFDLTTPTIEVSVDEGVQGVVLETVKATDDQGYRVQKVTYDLLQQVIPDYLTIGADSGVITLVKSLDRESIPGGKLEQLITAEDDGNPPPVLTSTATLIITVNDVNDNSPVYSEPTFQLALPQTYQAGQQFTIPTATDADEGENARVVYQLSAQAEQYFSIDRDSSVLTTRAECGVECIKTEDCSLGMVTVYAFNEGLPLLNDSLKVELILTTPGSAGPPLSGLISCADASTPNNNDPVFQPPSYVGQVPENSAINTLVLKVSATDADAGNSGNLTFSVNSPDFSVNADDGTVYTLRTFDYEQLPADKQLCVDVVATDKGRPPRSSTAEVCVTVVNVNDNPPSFGSSTYQATVRDGDPVDTDVITLTADDADGMDDLTYDLLGTNPYFKINPQTGLVSLAQSMNRADILNGITGEIIEIRVRANDGPFSAEASIQVTIESSNLHSPVFARDVISIDVPEGTVGTITSLSASDQDVPAQTISYRIADQAYNGIFSINPSTGEISVVSGIDRENLPTALVSGTASVVVLAVDNGTPKSNTGTATVNIAITDVNDNKPQFAENYFEIRLSEDFKPGQVIQLPDASDKDLGENARIVYTVSSEALTRFSADTNTLTTTTTCDKNCVKTVDCALLQFTLEAYNPDKPQNRSQLPVSANLLFCWITQQQRPKVLQRQLRWNSDRGSSPKHCRHYRKHNGRGLWRQW
ncbi:protocadherin-like wing polarity protein stan [Liolophura sinensis]|uniref:protocadherin-like wing polarity protein stan n=1 Tax=Liolophura sinensis TaxID=3198878 RepID=UPI0031582DA1